MRIISDSYLKLLTIPLPQSMNLYFGATEYPRILRMVLTEKGPPLYSGLYDFSIYRSPGNQKTYVECTKSYVGTLPPRPFPANHKPQTREPWP